MDGSVGRLIQVAAAAGLAGFVGWRIGNRSAAQAESDWLRALIIERDEV